MKFDGNTYLGVALAVAAIAFVLHIIGPFLNRWRKKLESDLKRMKEGQQSQKDHR